MADHEFQARLICGENWWNNNPRRNGYESSLFSPIINEIGSISWPVEYLMDMKARSSDESGSANNSEESIIFQEIQKPKNQESAYDDRSLWMDSGFDMVGSGLSSTITTDWNQTLMHDKKVKESNYQSFLQEDINSSSHHEDVTIDYSQIKKDWSPKNLSTLNEKSSMNVFKPSNQDFPVTSYGYATSSLLQTLFDDNSDSQSQDSIFGNREMDYSSATNNCGTKFCTSPKFTSLLKPSTLPKEEPLNHLNLSNNGTLWNSSATTMNDVRAFEDTSNFSKLTSKLNNDKIRDLSSMEKKNNYSETTFKRPRIETPSSLPTFKVRKEKLGDRITALQQLVSPFGKTDTASVLHEAIEYIKLLHDQVSVLSTPYMKSGSPIQCEQMLTKSKVTELGENQDLRRRGLCLVPISSTFPVATETSADFWTPTFGAILR